jgi:hypothetical protein
MGLPRTSIAGLMILATIVAIDVAWLRLIYAGGSSLFGFECIVLDLGVLTMGNVLAVGLVRLIRRRGAGCPFLVGFELSGLAALVVYLVCCRAGLTPGLLVFVSPPYLRTYDEGLAALGLGHAIVRLPELQLRIFFGLSQAALFTLPQVCAATLAGWGWRSLRRARG